MTLRLMTTTKKTLKAVPAHPQIMIINHSLPHTRPFHHSIEAICRNCRKYFTIIRTDILQVVNLRVLPTDTPELNKKARESKKRKSSPSASEYSNNKRNDGNGSSEMVESLIFNLVKCKSEKNYDGVDFEGDVLNLYSKLR